MPTNTMPYRPSSGTEGEMFQHHFCYRCDKYGTDNDPCPIQGRALIFDVDDPDYPSEWVCDDNDDETNPRCTAF